MKLSLKKYLIIVMGLFLINPIYSYANNTNPKIATPYINSIYSGKMMRINDIPLYGKNKHMYFYNEKPIDEGDFHGSGLYLFGSFAMGKTKTGVNVEEDVKVVDDGRYKGGSTLNKSMGMVNSFTLGVGREMSNSLSMEFVYSNYYDMNYGKYAKYTDPDGDDDSSGGDSEEDEGNSLQVMDDDKEGDESDKSEMLKSKVFGGNISAEFIGLGLKYNLDKYTGSFGGRLKPYVGITLGVSQNTITDYTVLDENGYSDSEDSLALEDYTLEDYLKLDAEEEQFSKEYKDGELNFIGASNRNLAAVLEAGLSIVLEGNLQLDLFYKINKLGQVKTSGNVLSTYDLTTTSYYRPGLNSDYSPDSGDALPSPEHYLPCNLGGVAKDIPLSDGSGSVRFCIFDEEESEGIQSRISERKEVGSMTFRQYGIKLRYMF